MSADDLQAALARFTKENKFRGKGAICVALVVTQHARNSLPLDSKLLVTEGGGQVLGLGKGAVQAVLAKHGIDRILSAEGGRTSRGSLELVGAGFPNTASKPAMRLIPIHPRMPEH